MPILKTCITITQDFISKEISEVHSFEFSDSLEFAINLQKKNVGSEIFIDCDEDSFLLKMKCNLTGNEKEITSTSEVEIKGLVPFIAIDPEGVILMQAFGNTNALDLSIQSGFAHYYSRSRNKLWKKGEESGNLQKISKISYLEKTPAIIFKIQKRIPSCHTGFYSCYYRKLRGDSFVEVYSKKEFDPEKIYKGK